MSDENIDQLFKKAAQNYQSAADEDAWAALSQRLDEAEGRGAAASGYYKSILLVIGILFLIGTITLWWGYSNNGNESITGSSVPEESTPTDPVESMGTSSTDSSGGFTTLKEIDDPRLKDFQAKNSYQPVTEVGDITKKPQKSEKSIISQTEGTFIPKTDQESKTSLAHHSEKDEEWKSMGVPSKDMDLRLPDKPIGRGKEAGRPGEKHTPRQEGDFIADRALVLPENSERSTISQAEGSFIPTNGEESKTPVAHESEKAEEWKSMSVPSKVKDISLPDKSIVYDKEPHMPGEKHRPRQEGGFIADRALVLPENSERSTISKAEGSFIPTNGEESKTPVADESEKAEEWKSMGVPSKDKDMRLPDKSLGPDKGAGIPREKQTSLQEDDLVADRALVLPENSERSTISQAEGSFIPTNDEGSKTLLVHRSEKAEEWKSMSVPSKDKDIGLSDKSVRPDKAADMPSEKHTPPQGETSDSGAVLTPESQIYDPTESSNLTLVCLNTLRSELQLNLKLPQTTINGRDLAYSGAGKEKTQVDKEEPHHRDLISLKVGYAPDLSSVGYFAPDEPGSNIGFFIEYHLNSRWSISSGLIRSNKIYFSEDPEQYKGTGYNRVDYDRLNAECTVLDIPLNVNYYLKKKPNHNLIMSFGLSSYLMLTEDYDYFLDRAGNQQEWSARIEGENNHYFNLMNLSFAYEQRLKGNLYLQLEPFVKTPISGVGEGRVNLVSSGLFVGLKYNFQKVSNPVIKK